MYIKDRQAYTKEEHQAVLEMANGYLRECLLNYKKSKSFLKRNDLDVSIGDRLNRCKFYRKLLIRAMQRTTDLINTKANSVYSY